MSNWSRLSVRQFERRFAALMGVPPKTYARIGRIQKALEKMRSPELRWADIAQMLGYYDQMHMVHDFRHLAGSNPSKVAPQLALYVKDELDAAP